MVKKKILLVTEIYPSGLTGTSVKARSTIESLLSIGYWVDVICVSYSGLEEIKMSDDKLNIFSIKSESSKRSISKFLKKAISLSFSLTPIHVRRMYSPNKHQFLSIIVQSHEYDHVLFNEFSTLQYIDKKDNKFIYVDDEDITDLFLRRFRTEKNFLKKIILFFEYKKCLKFEKKYLERVSQIWAISPNTAKRLKTISNAKTTIMPTVVAARPNVYQKKAANIVFTGTLDWPENYQGLKWFIQNCWIKIVNQYPKVKLYVVGQSASSQLLDLIKKYPGIIHKGYVKDLQSVYKQSALAIAPIFINSGIKVKILTYLSYGLPVVAINQATWGMSSARGVLTTNKKNFEKSILDLLADPAKRKKMSLQARQNIKKYHSQKTLEKFFKKNGITRKK